MSQIITINNVELPVVEYCGQRVVTLAMVDSAHQRPDDTAGRNFREHRSRLIEAEDFFEVTADEIRRQSLGHAFAPRTSKGILLTESGYLMLVKSLQDDLAWQVQRDLVKGYFRAEQGSALMSQAEMFLASAKAMVEMERKKAALEAATTRVEQRVDELVEYQLMTKRPSNAEAITHIRRRIFQEWGLPERVVDLVIRQMPYSPKPAGMVKNAREEAEGASYAVYWSKDVNVVFRRFVAECRQDTPAFVTHPFVEGRFRLTPGSIERAGGAA